MKVELYFNALQTDELQFRDRVVVVIDVLRAGTTIATALLNGAKEIIPVTSVESAVKMGTNLFGDVTLLGGERNAKTIEGFNLGNSPLEYTEHVVKGKSIIFHSSNGSQAVLKGRHAKRVVLAAFVNISRVVDFLLGTGAQIALLCAGRSTDGFSLEDTLCGGMIVSKLLEKAEQVEFTDSSLMALTLYKNFGKNILKALRTSEHGRYLTDLGFEDDIKLCAGVDTVPVLPTLEGSVIRRLKTARGRTKKLRSRHTVRAGS
ncbi:MAG: 2-phosphosulfolactate phosphatase [Bacteroidota bacterium]